ncbi:MAG: hypothetical protein ACOCXA_08420 [Planctomycetota bacterium]
MEHLLWLQCGIVAIIKNHCERPRAMGVESLETEKAFSAIAADNEPSPPVSGCDTHRFAKQKRMLRQLDEQRPFPDEWSAV